MHHYPAVQNGESYPGSKLNGPKLEERAATPEMVAGYPGSA